ncbi:hypothetical protein DAPPUDRAFT_232909 [Daphnia pulex]|uniref:Uncharacterized protein n=1 Tax=Daphnia pulex TaxID=6669 RepID=E9FSN9_DAPPU|nr:hypothetical protein DAPPUDRAFT_232909 [Daphnia pulex]|eukprot:EFX89233.1 hypothetical protein DAPPUDRAFT_232909 [Daphnia pulex]
MGNHMGRPAALLIARIDRRPVSTNAAHFSCPPPSPCIIISMQLLNFQENTLTWTDGNLRASTRVLLSPLEENSSLDEIL